MHKSVLLAPTQVPRFEDLVFPQVVQPKYDGFRCLCYKGHLFTRSLLPQPNMCLYAYLEPVVEYCAKNDLILDGELYSLDRSFTDLSSILRSSRQPVPSDFNFYAFDCMTELQWLTEHMPEYQHRLSELEDRVEDINFEHLISVPWKLLDSPETLPFHHTDAVGQGFEGLILRNPYALYKHGRATFRENIIHKIKHFDYLDAQIVGFEVVQVLQPEAQVLTSPTGKMKRSHRSEDYVPGDYCGSLIVRDELGRQFSCGWSRGWSIASRRTIWLNRQNFLGHWVRVRCLPGTGYDLPRSPQFVDFRDSK